MFCRELLLKLCWEKSTTVFSFPKKEDLKKRWVKFVNWKDWEPTSSSYICIKHFEEKYYEKGKNIPYFNCTKDVTIDWLLN